MTPGETYITERGVLLDTFKAYGGEFGAARDFVTIATRLNRDPVRVGRDPNWTSVEEILWFPLYGPAHELIHWLARPLPKYRESKFVAPIGSDSMPWIPPETRAAAKDIDKPIVITEGPVKGMSLLQAGTFPISLVGVWGVAASRKKTQPAQEEPPSDSDDENHDDGDRARDPEASDFSVLKIHPELASFALEYRQVLLCFDADHLKNRNVRQAEIRAFMLFYAAGADVYQLCTWPLAEGKGVDDYLSAKAGSDPEKQKQIFSELCSNQRKTLPFIETLDRRDIELVRKELHRTQDDAAKFKELAKALAKQLNVAIADLIPFQGGDSQQQGEKQYPSGAKAVDIPATAEPWGEPVVAAEVLDEICAAIRRFVWMKTSYYRAAALWVVLTYLPDVVDILPILLITSPEEDCGKTTLLELVLYLSSRPIPASNISAAAIYRTIGDNCPTLILDEADAFMGDDEAMRGVINSGHKREFAFVIRVINDKGDTGQFSTWCPKAIARIGQPKRTILSRSIPIRIERKPKGMKTEKLKSGHKPEFEDLRRKISRLGNDIRAQVQLFRSQSDWLNNRAGDNWEPLFAIATAAGGEWLKATEAAALKMSSKAAQDSKSFGHYLLECLGDIFAEKRAELKKQEFKLEEGGKFFFTTEDLLTELNKDEEAPWRERKDEVLTAHKLAKELKEYDIASAGRRGDRTRGYWSDEIEAAVEKYKAEQQQQRDKIKQGDEPEEEGDESEKSDDTDAEDPF